MDRLFLDAVGRYVADVTAIFVVEFFVGYLVDLVYTPLQLIRGELSDRIAIDS